MPFRIWRKSSSAAKPLFADRLLILKLHRLRHTPPALYSARMLAQNDLEVLALELLQGKEADGVEEGDIATRQVDLSLRRFLPRRLRPTVGYWYVLGYLFFHCLSEGRPRLVLAEGIIEQALAWALKRLLGIPYAVHVLEAWEREELQGSGRVFFDLEGRALREAEFLIFPEKSRAEIYQKRYGLTRPYFIVYNCPPLFEKPLRTIDLQARLGLPNDSFLMLYMGGIGEANALREAIQALTAFPALHLLLAGWAEPEFKQELEQLAAREGVSERLHFLGALKDQKWDFLASVDLSYCVYFPRTLRLQHAATASNKLMEALAAGIPVITRSSPDFRKIVEVDDVGVCADEITKDGIARAIRRLLDDEEWRKRCARNARRRHIEEYHFERQFAPVIAYIHSWSQSKKAPGTSPGAHSA